MTFQSHLSRWVPLLPVELGIGKKSYGGERLKVDRFIWGPRIRLRGNWELIELLVIGG
jgi:hypothetical protein